MLNFLLEISPSLTFLWLQTAFCANDLDIRTASTEGPGLPAPADSSKQLADLSMITDTVNIYRVYIVL